MKIGLYMICLLLFARETLAQNAVSLMDSAAVFYNKHEYAQAGKIYEQLINGNQKNYKASYYLALCQYASGNLNAAEINLKLIILKLKNSNDSLLDEANYNLGVILAGRGELKDCISAFKNALKANFRDIMARDNLQLAINALKQEQLSRSEKKADERKDNSRQPDEGKQPQKQFDPSKMTKKMKTLKLKEKKLLDSMRNVKRSQSKSKIKNDW